MRICVVGAGAIGGLLAARLHAAGEDVHVIARGSHLAAIKANGLKLLDGEREVIARVKASDSLEAAGRQDLVILAVKAHQLSAVVGELGKTYGRDTMVLSAQNGIPWWYFLKGVTEHPGRRLESVDPGGRIAAHVPIERVIGSVVYAAADIAAPGIIRHGEGNRFSLAEIDDADTPRIRALSETFIRAGFKAPVAADIRLEIWTKLLGNLTFNPISALTHATLAAICRYPLTRALAAEMMEEAKTIGEKLGVKFRISIDKRIAGAETVGEHKTSMLQDVEGGRFLEIDALLGSVIELGRLTATPTPHLDAVYACTKLLGETLVQAKAGLKLA
jgi:2-dehydropantoate 2-reductase